MPEMPEVNTVKNVLLKQILNKKIINVQVLYPKMIKTDVLEFSKLLKGESFKDIHTKGKWLIFELNKYYLLSHLRMEGKYHVKDAKDPIQKHEHVIITFDDNLSLRYDDTRKFGTMSLILKKEIDSYPSLLKQGYEPNSKDLTGKYLLEKFKNKSIAIKTLLLDQTIISGLGNIYANEVLFDAKVHPLKEGKNLTIEECDKIVKSANKIISKAIELGGTTIKSYTSSLGVTGNYQNELKVHKREGKKCLVCKDEIVRIKVNGRSTYYCPTCQK